MKSKIYKKVKKISQKQSQSQNVILNINLKNNKRKVKSNQPKQPKQQNIINVVKPVAPTFEQSNNKYLLDQHAANLLDLKNKIKNDLIYNKSINSNINELKNLEKIKQRMLSQGIAPDEQLNLKEDLLTQQVVTENSLRDDNDELLNLREREPVEQLNLRDRNDATETPRKEKVHRIVIKNAPLTIKSRFKLEQLITLFERRLPYLNENARNEANHIQNLIDNGAIKKDDLANFLSKYGY